MSSAILVILGKQEWTQQALHLSAALAREWRTAVALVRMEPVAHLEYLGAGLRETLLPYEELVQLQAWTDTVAAYGVPVSLRLFEFTDYLGGVLSAAEQLDATAVFAPAPSGRLPGLARLRGWWPRRKTRTKRRTSRATAPR